MLTKLDVESSGVMYIVHLKHDPIYSATTTKLAHRILKVIAPLASRTDIVKELWISIVSLRKHMPDIPITIVTDTTSLKRLRYLDIPNINFIIAKQEEGFSWEDKIRGFRYSPYNNTLFLDTDTYICCEISEIFELLDNFDMAIAHEPIRESGYNLGSLPSVFPQFNTGVIAFRNSVQFSNFVEAWSNYHHELLELSKHQDIAMND